MSDRKIGHILFALALFLIFGSFFLYAGFYRTASSLIRGSVQKTLLWSKLMDAQLELQRRDSPLMNTNTKPIDTNNLRVN